MSTHPPPEDQGRARTLLELSREVMRGPETLRKHIREGKIEATRTANLYTFTHAQWITAVLHYRHLDARQEGHVGDDRPA